MKFLIDHDVYAVTIRFLKDLEHDAVPVKQIGLSQAEDSLLLDTAQKQKRLFVTRDRDFGRLVFLRGLGAGVIYLRIRPSIQDVVHKEFQRVLEAYSEDELNGAFVVIEAGRHRFRKI